MIFFRIFKHLLPISRAWSIIIEKKLRQFFEGLSGLGLDIRTFYDNIYDDISPRLTRNLTEYEKQFGLPSTGLTDPERRTRLQATWKALGGQDISYIQQTLQANGFNVFVHEWWVPGTEPAIGVKQCVTPRNPLLVLRRESNRITYVAECGEAVAECGEAVAECGNTIEPAGYPLVNKVLQTVQDIIPLCGEAVAECGEAVAECGGFVQFREEIRQYIIPIDSGKWPYFIYIGGVIYGDLADIETTRRNEFESLCLKICPTQQWIGILVNYT